MMTSCRKKRGEIRCQNGFNAPIIFVNYIQNIKRILYAVVIIEPTSMSTLLVTTTSLLCLGHNRWMCRRAALAVLHHLDSARLRCPLACRHLQRLLREIHLRRPKVLTLNLAAQQVDYRRKMLPFLPVNFALSMWHELPAEMIA